MSCGGGCMDRGVVIGGLLICASFLLAISLNRSAEAPAHTDAVGSPVAVRCGDARPDIEGAGEARTRFHDDPGEGCDLRVDEIPATPDSAGSPIP